MHMYAHCSVLIHVSVLIPIYAGVAPVLIEPTRANAMHLLRSSLAQKLVGRTLATQLSRMILAEVAEVKVPLLSDSDICLGLKRDLTSSLEELHCEGEDLVGDEALISCHTAKRLRRDPEGQLRRMAAMTQQVLFAIENRVPFSRLEGTVAAAGELIADLAETSPSSSSPGASVEDLLSDRTSLVRHMLLLDAAVDRYILERLFQMREDDTFAGAALATDESPPSQPRFRGLRFQITIVYIGSFLPEAQWEALAVPPMSRTSMLGDIAHCPGKKGTDVCRVIGKQFTRWGLPMSEVVAATGDGGGENLGKEGIHAYFESLSPGYVRRRCLPHIAWRTADMAIRASGLDYKTLAAYLVEGITWNRLKGIGTKTRNAGGLQLFKDRSTACNEVFGTAPAAIITNRPETDLRFLKFLKGKEHILYKLAVKDLDQRPMAADTMAAVRNLGDIGQRVRRHLLCEILERCMFLAYWTAAHPIVAKDTSLETLMDKACNLILDLSVTQEVLQRFTVENGHAQLQPRPSRTWVELAVFQIVGEEAVVEETLPEALDFHREVTDKAAAHLRLIQENNMRTPWLAANMLSTDPRAATAAAASLAQHLTRTKPGNRTPFEQHVFESSELWDNLVDFSRASPPCLLWHGHGKYKALFRFIAPRFLLSPDHVLDAERVHARWQWLCSIRRALKMHSLNACLRLTHYLENNQAFPTTEDLAPHLGAERLHHRLSLEAIEAEGEVALGCRFSSSSCCLGGQDIQNTCSNTGVFESKGTDTEAKPNASICLKVGVPLQGPIGPLAG